MIQYRPWLVLLSLKQPQLLDQQQQLLKPFSLLLHVLLLTYLRQDLLMQVALVQGQ
jgi:hypothetical protein